MNIEEMKTVFQSLPNCDAWSLQLLKIKTSKQDDKPYTGIEIVLSPEGTLTSFVAEIAKRYIDGSKGELNLYDDIIEYNGSIVDRVIYWLYKTDKLISDRYGKLIEAIANPDTELDPLEFNASAYVLRGEVHIDGKKKAIKLISMKKPVTSLKHKFLRANKTFKEITDKVISLCTLIDVVIIEDTVYMLTSAGEKLFNMERAYKVACDEKLNEIEQCSIVTDFKAFSSIARSGNNPRKFVSFNDEHLKKLKNSEIRATMAKKFNIPIRDDLFDTTQSGATVKIVKLLCDRGMVDPFDDNPMEVAGSKKWE